MKHIYITTQSSIQEHPKEVIHILYKNWAIKVTVCVLANLEGKLGYIN